MDVSTRATVARQLADIERYLAGVRVLVEADQHCPDVLRKSHAVRRAIKQLDSKLIAGHLYHCLMHGAERRHDDLVDDMLEACDVAFH